MLRGLYCVWNQQIAYEKWCENQARIALFRYYREHYGARFIRVDQMGRVIVWAKSPIPKVERGK